MQNWTIRKPQVASDRGIIACQHFEAAEAGARVLAQGGNAMDAAVVAALVLSVVEPWLSGIGGGGLLLWADAAGGPVESLDFNVRAGEDFTAEDYPLVGGKDGDWFDWPAVKDDRNLIGYGSICIPGAIAGLAEALKRHGTLSWHDALQPAITLAERGMLVDWFTSLCLAIDARGLAQFQTSASMFLPDGKPLNSGAQTYCPMPAKAATLRRLAKAGARDFYEGEVAQGLIRDLQAGGSRLTAADLAGYRPIWGTAASTAYAGHDVHVPPELCGGPSMLECFSTLRGEAPLGTEAEAAAAYARAIRTAYEDRLKTMGHASRGGKDCTSHLSVVDAAGNMVSLTNTLLSRFGSKVTLPSSGILMNNGMMWFDPRPGMPNSIAPNARPLANMCPTILTRDDRPVMAIGAAGGRQIFPAITQLVSYVLDRGMTLEDAFHAPRIDASTPTVVVDTAAADGVAAAVGRHYPVRMASNGLHPVNFSIPSAVMLDPATGQRTGMAHPVSPWTACASETAVPHD
ncbi:gamma-glutamyltransferase [Paracoccus indicus]|uniref:gamma-glutamyltransferase n=1 Tax=Paracoccus indicus TaxID=2079229 RepID=UPI000D36E02E|nr:gamma-glutamyltransferase [Paracoccus indicus]